MAVTTDATVVPAGANPTDLGAWLQAAIAGGYVAHPPAVTYTVTSPIVIYVNNTIQGPLGIDLGGATIVSQITDGSPVIQVVVGPGVDLRYLTFSNFTIQGNGREGDGIQLVAAGNDRWLYNFLVDNVTVNNVGGYGLNVQGSVFEGLVSNSWMTNNADGGAYFGHLVDGQVSALRWFGGGFESNGGPGLTLGNGARDISVDGASFIHNNGMGISAEGGITSVSSSTFTDNKGPGVWFQNYGNFSGNTFASTGAQTIGITGWQNGNSTLVGNTSTGSALANLQGYGATFLTGDIGQVTTGSNIAVGVAGGGNVANVSAGTQGVALPALAAVTAATTAAVANTTGISTLETALDAAVAGGYVADLSGQTYTVTAPIVINLTSSTQGPIGIDLGGAKIVSQITNGRPVIEIIVGPGVNIGTLTLSNFMIQGSGGEGDGIKIVVDGTDRSIGNLNISNVNVEHVGGIGLDVLGNVSGTVFNSWMHGNAQGGARFANSAGGGVADGLEWTGGGFRKNGVAGLILDNGANDVTVKGAYFVENNGPGIVATSGITLVQQSGFENNLGTGAIIQGTANFVDDTFSTHGRQQVGIGGYVAGGKVSLTGDSNEYYGGGSDTTLLANIQGSGTLAIAGGGNVVAGTSVTMTGGFRGNDAIIGSSFGDTLYGYDPNTKFTGGGGNDLIFGTAGTNTSVYSGISSHYKVTVTVGSPAITVHDKIGTDGTDSLTNIQNLLFSDKIIDAAMFTTAASLSAPQFSSLVEVYVASFNRAPDALGLGYWGSRLKNDMSLQDIAKSFFAQSEASVFYPTSQSTQGFVTSVYNNALNRGPDSAGLAYWTNELQTGHISNDSFLLAIINGAHSTTGGAIDVQVLANKQAVGAHFALTQGLSNGAWAKSVMSGVDGTAASVSAANLEADSFSKTADSSSTAELVVQIVGVSA